MADFKENMEKWGKKFTEVATEVGKKTEEQIEIQKIKSKVRSLNRSNDRDYIDIGKAIMDKYLNGEEIDSDMAELCEAIVARDEQIEEHMAEIEKIKGAE